MRPADILIALLMFIPLSGVCQQGQVRNLLKPYYHYQQAVQRDKSANKVALFRQLVLQADTAFYQSVIGPKDSTFLAGYLHFVDGDLNAGIRLLEKGFDGQYQTAIRQITKAFPEAARFTYKVYICLSLFSSNGQVKKMNDRYVVYYGLDVAAYFKAQPDDLLPLIEHEYFHLLQANINPAVYDQINASFTGAETCPIYLQLFSEGLATYFPMHLNPAMPIGKALFNDSLATQCKPIEKQLAGKLLSIIDSRDKANLYQFFSIKREKTDVPDRAAYYIGAEIVRRTLERGSRYEQLLRLPPQAVRELVISELKAMKKS